MEADPAASEATSHSQSCSTTPESSAFCRLCWGEAEEGAAWELVSPCSCSGTLQHIHCKCLYDWQQTLRQQGLHRRALVCELCKQPYTMEVQPTWCPQRHACWRPIDRLTAHVLAVTRAPSMSQLLLRLWKSYVWASGAYSALRGGGSGLRAGLSLGRHLVEEQAGLLAHCLASMTALLGSPYAELLWCQAVGALVVGLLTELVYSSLLGLLLGAVYGFCTGYAGAVKASLQAGRILGVGAVGVAVTLGKHVVAGAGQLLRYGKRLPLLGLGWLAAHCCRRRR